MRKTRDRLTIAASAFLAMVGTGVLLAQEPGAFNSLQVTGVAVVNVPVDAEPLHEGATQNQGKN